MTYIEQLKNSGGEHLGKADVAKLLTAESGLQEELFAWAREVRRDNQADDVLLRGVIEISNHCQKNCDYCAMRFTNKELNRYTLNPEEILTLAATIKDAGIHIVFLQGGQNPGNDHILEQVIPIIKNELKQEVLLCLGERPQSVYEKFAQLGADSYILKYETSDAALYQEISHTPLERRLQYIDWIKAAGLKLGTGNIVGLPDQTLESLVNDILLDIRIKPDFVSSSPFIPSSNTPLQNHTFGNVNLTLNTMAILRVALKTPLIPSVSALESVYKDGQTMGLNAGANVITINFTPKKSQDLYKIYSERRFVVSLEHAKRSIENAGLRIRSRED
ncbi:MAG: radical SAM protein [Geobacteraceae bacterium]|nr:radical SAM protein [Geobacteraceae bacterium]